MTCDKCGQPLPEKHEHRSDGDWTEPFMDINHRMFQTSKCRDCGKLMIRELRRDKTRAKETV